VDSWRAPSIAAGQISLGFGEHFITDSQFV